MVICLGRSSGLWFTLLPVPSHPVTDSGSHGFRPHSQRRDREGVAPSSLCPRVTMCRHFRRLCRNLSSSLLSVYPLPAQLAIINPCRADKSGHIPKACRSQTRHKAC